MMGGEIAQHPGGRAAALADHRGQLEQGAVGELAAADAGRLQHAEQAARMQVGDRFVRQAAQLLGPRSPLAEHRDQRLGARQKVFEARRFAALGLRLRHCDPFPDYPTSVSSYPRKRASKAEWLRRPPWTPACAGVTINWQSTRRTSARRDLSTPRFGAAENGDGYRYSRPCRAGQPDRGVAQRAEAVSVGHAA